MRILYVINSLDGGGAALPLADVIGVMRDAGHEVSVASLMERDGRARGRLEAAAIPYSVVGGRRRGTIRTAFRLDRLLARDRPDILWTSLTHATILGELLGAARGIPVVSWLHNAYLKPVNEAVLRRTQSLTRHWLADSAEVAAFGSDRLGIPPAAIHVWPLFIAEPAAPIAQPWNGQGTMRIGSLGRLHPNKGYDVLLRAVAAITRRDPGLAARLDFVVAGEGAERARLQASARRLSLANVRFPGFEPSPRAFLAGLHAYVQPSHHEGLCIAAHEAMQAGLPVVATRVGEIQRSIDASGGGSLVEYGDVEGLAAALVRLAASPEQCAAMGVAARGWVRAFYSREAFRRNGVAAIEAALGPVAVRAAGPL